MFCLSGHDPSNGPVRARLPLAARGVLVPALLLSVAALVTGCKSSSADANDPSAPPRVRVDGSSTVFPIMEAVGEEYQKLHRDVQVTVGISGTGGGFKKLCHGEIDVCDASRPIKPTEVEACGKKGVGFIELPVALDGIVIVVNPKNDWVTTLTTADLKKMWSAEAQRTVMSWRDVRPEWPDRPLRLFGAGVDSGTYDFFTLAVNDKERSSRADYTSSEDDNVIVQGVQADENALAFFGLAYWVENKDKVRAVAIDDGKPGNGDGPIMPSVESVRGGTYQPLARPLFFYVNAQSINRPAVGAFVDYALGHAAPLVEEVGYVPLPVEARTLAEARAKNRVTGTVFVEGAPRVGLTLNDLMRLWRGDTPATGTAQAIPATASPQATPKP
jgi:phosphate transport system substrate-binding protein